jgi:hypothetical protein
MVTIVEWFKRFTNGHEDLQNGLRSGHPSTTPNADTIATVLETVTRDRGWAVGMMEDELKLIKRRFVKFYVKLYGRGRRAQSSCHRDLWMSRNKADIIPRLHPHLSRQS